MNVKFSPEHSIWKYANWADELDDWLNHAEYLICKWSEQPANEVKFVSTFQIIIAAHLLIDNLLPASARLAFVDVMLSTVKEASDKKLTLKALKISPAKPGRKRDAAHFNRCHEVKELLQTGMAVTQAYLVVAEKFHKSPDTIRRDFERVIKKSKERLKKGTGEFDK